MLMPVTPPSACWGVMPVSSFFAAGLIWPPSLSQRIIADTMSVLHRRGFLETTIAAAAAIPQQARAASTRPRLGVTISVVGKSTPAEAIGKVHAFGLPTCQVHVGMAPASLASPLKDALAKYQVDATAVMTLGPGRMVWDFYDGPRTIGIEPPETRTARMDALK